MLLSNLYTVEFRHWWEFLWVMTEKEIKARYKFTILGFLWMILNPLMQMLMMGFILKFFIPVKVENYFVFLFSGLLVWNFYSLTVTKNTPMFLNERALIQKAKFPRESIILSIVLSNLFHFLISLSLVYVYLFFQNQINISVFPAILLGLIWLIIFSLGMSLITATLNVRFRDVNFFVNAIMPIWFYATPIVYTLDLLPKTINKWFYINPVTGIIEMFRYGMLGIMPYSSELLIISSLTTVAIFGFGVYIFIKESPNFDDWM